MAKALNILLIGGAGFIGSWLSKSLHQRGHNVVVVDNYASYYKYKNEGAMREFRQKELLRPHTTEIITGDFRGQMDYVFNKYAFNVIVNLAAVPLEEDFDSRISRTQLSDDIELVYQVVFAARKYRVRRVVHMSSLFAYGDFLYSSNENQPLVPKTPYGISKATGEFIVKNYAPLEWNIIRTTSVYGFGDINNRVTQILINRALNKEKFWINNGALLDFIYIEDLAEGIAEVITQDYPNEDFHISGGKAVKIIDFVRELKLYFPEMTYTVENHDDRPMRGTLENTKARMLLGWEPKYDLEQGVARYMEFVRKYHIA